MPAKTTTASNKGVSSGAKLIRVDQHATLRFLQRVDPGAFNPEERLRRMWRDGYDEDVDDIRSSEVRRHGDYRILWRGDRQQPVIVTVLNVTGGDR